MHELSIAMSLVDRACEEVERLGGARIIAVHLRVGPLAGVVEDALTFSFDVVAADSAIAGARLVVEPVPLTAWCVPCAAERAIASPQHLRCPVCGAPTPEVRHGAELELFALEVDDDVPTHRGGPRERPQAE